MLPPYPLRYPSSFWYRHRHDDRSLWATDPQRNTNLQNGVKPLDNDKTLRNAERHFEDRVHDINKAVDNTNAGNFGTNPTHPTPLWESVFPTDANNYQQAQRIRLGITDIHNRRKDNPTANGNGNGNTYTYTYTYTSGNTYSRPKDKKFSNNNNNNNNNNTQKDKDNERVPKTNLESSNAKTRKNL
jgi:hypothetical protein